MKTLVHVWDNKQDSELDNVFKHVVHSRVFFILNSTSFTSLTIMVRGMEHKINK